MNWKERNIETIGVVDEVVGKATFDAQVSVVNGGPRRCAGVLDDMVGRAVDVGLSVAVGTAVGVEVTRVFDAPSVEVSAGGEELPPHANADTATARVASPHYVRCESITETAPPVRLGVMLG